MGFLKITDAVLANSTIARWTVVLVAALTLVYSVFTRIELGATRLQRDAAKGQSKTYEAYLQFQNREIRQANKEYEAQQAQVQEATVRAARIKKDAESWRKKAQSTPLTGTCENMVDQVLAELKQ